jgi:putative ATP-dependent endonuclease of the OLD family
VTRAELFFARRVIFVEGAAELLMVNLLAKRSAIDLRNHGVSLISVEGLNFDSFLPLFGQEAIKVPVAVLTDADPLKITVPGGKPVAQYPALGEAVIPSANAAAMKLLEDDFIKVFHGVKTFEYDFALHGKNRNAMLAALKDIHPQIGAALEVVVDAAGDDAAKAQALFKGMFERSEGNVQKGRFAQALASKIEDDKMEIVVPEYILAAVKHASQK